MKLDVLVVLNSNMAAWVKLPVPWTVTLVELPPTFALVLD